MYQPVISLIHISVVPDSDAELKMIGVGVTATVSDVRGFSVVFCNLQNYVHLLTYLTECLLQKMTQFHRNAFSY